MMTERSLRVLEFTRIREMLAEGALTALGAEKCRELVPFDTLYDIDLAQRETEEAAVILQYVGGHPLTEFPDARPALTVCEKGGTLSPGMLLSVAGLLRASRAARDVLITDRESTPLLQGRAQLLSEARNVERDITDAILSEDEIADRASSELMNIRRHLRGAQDRIKDKLNQMVRSSLQKYLQESIVTVRNNRYVIPVRAEYRAMVPGLVHDQSSSGATLFIEPMAAVEMGNEIREWEIKEAREIDRILAALSAEVAPYAEGLRANVEMLGELDFIFAKGLLSRRLRCVAPKMNTRGFLHILRGRHPLIDPEKVVPSDIYLGYPKAMAMELAVRTMSPQYLLCDELGAEEADAILAAQNAGVPLIASAHAPSLEALLRRPALRRLHEAGVFGHYVGIRREGRGFFFDMVCRGGNEA